MLPAGEFDIVELTSNYSTGLRDADLQAFGTLTKLRHLRIQNSDVTGSGLTYLRGLSEMATLSLNRCPLGDAYLDELDAWPKLTNLDVSFTQITDAGLSKLQRPPSLEYVTPDKTRVSDSGVALLQGFANVVNLQLRDTSIGVMRS